MRSSDKGETMTGSGLGHSHHLVVVGLACEEVKIEPVSIGDEEEEEEKKEEEWEEEKKEEEEEKEEQKEKEEEEKELVFGAGEGHSGGEEKCDVKPIGTPGGGGGGRGATAAARERTYLCDRCDYATYRRSYLVHHTNEKHLMVRYLRVKLGRFFCVSEPTLILFDKGPVYVRAEDVLRTGSRLLKGPQAGPSSSFIIK